MRWSRVTPASSRCVPVQLQTAGNPSTLALLLLRKGCGWMKQYCCVFRRNRVEPSLDRGQRQRLSFEKRMLLCLLRCCSGCSAAMTCRCTAPMLGNAGCAAYAVGPLFSLRAVPRRCSGSRQTNFSWTACLLCIDLQVCSCALECLHSSGMGGTKWYKQYWRQARRACIM